MGYTNIDVLFNDTKSSDIKTSNVNHNKKLVEFIDRNLDKIIINGNIKFNFIIVKKSMYSSLKTKGITRLPAVVVKKTNENVIGYDDIIAKINQLVSSNNVKAKPKSEEEIMIEFQNKELLKGSKRDSEGKLSFNDDEEKDETAEMLDNFHKASQKRNESITENTKTLKKTNYKETADDFMDDYKEDLSSLSNIKNEDDDMMAALMDKIAGANEF